MRANGWSFTHVRYRTTAEAAELAPRVLDGDDDAAG